MDTDSRGEGLCPFGEPIPQATPLASPAEPSGCRWRTGVSALVRLRAHWNSRVQVPDLADTAGPVAERNCIGAIPPGGEQREANGQSVTPSVRWGGQRELDSVGGSGESASATTKPERHSAASAEGVDAAGGEPQMVGDGMAGSSGDVNQGTTVGGAQRACRGQSVRSSWEASNDRGAKGRRNVVLGPSARFSHQGSDSAARLSIRTRRNTGLRRDWEPDSGPPRGGERAGNGNAAGATLPTALSRVPEPVHRGTTDWKAGCGRPACPVWEGGGVFHHSSDPHRSRVPAG